MGTLRKPPVPLDYASPATEVRPPAEDEEVRHKRYLYDVSTYGYGEDFTISCIVIVVGLLTLAIAAFLLPRLALVPVALAITALGTWARNRLVERKWEKFEKNHDDRGRTGGNRPT